MVSQWISADQFELEVSALTSGFVVTSVPYMPGWKAFDRDGVEQPVYRALMALMGTYVREGVSYLRFIYLPDSYLFGIRVRGLAIVISAIGFAFVSFQIWSRQRTRE
jgi:uncharacterized membrane protein YfhO